MLPVLALPNQHIGSSITYTSAFCAAAAICSGYVVLRRLTRYPGIMAISYVLPSFVFGFGATFSAVLFLRLDYARSFLLASFVLTIVWFHVVVLLSGRTIRPRFAVLPFGKVDALADIGRIDWVELKEPSLPHRNLSGLVADLRADMPHDWEGFLADCAIVGVPVYHYKQLFETLTGRVEIEHLSENNLGSLIPNSIYVQIKSWADRMIAGVAILLLSPMFVAIAVAIRLDSPGPVFFRQERTGFQGRSFVIWKFRTMTADHDGDARTKDNDHRVTRFGRFLRRSRIDELPQVFNILAGEMSWIGPRPEAKSLSEAYEHNLPYYRYRHIVRPGITGWAQVNQGHVFEVDEVLSKLHYDFFYIKYFSAWLDILIIMKTVRIMLTGFGAR